MADPRADLPEFHLVVKRPSRKGPIAPYRFAITVVFTLAVVGMDLVRAAETGSAVDETLIRTTIAAALAWIVLGRINAILKDAEPPPTRPSVDASEDDPVSTVA